MSSIRRLTAISSHITQRYNPLVSPTRPTPPFAKLGSSLSSPSPEMSAAVKQKVDSAIAEHKVVVFGKTWCTVSDSTCHCALFGSFQRSTMLRYWVR